MKIVSSIPVTPVKSTRSVSVMVRLSVRNRCPGESCSQVKPRPSVCMQISPDHLPCLAHLVARMSEAISGDALPAFRFADAGYYLVNVRQHVLDQSSELLHRITHGGNAKGDAPAARRLEPFDVLGAFPRRAVS